MYGRARNEKQGNIKTMTRKGDGCASRPTKPQILQTSNSISEDTSRKKCTVPLIFLTLPLYPPISIWGNIAKEGYKQKSSHTHEEHGSYTINLKKSSSGLLAETQSLNDGTVAFDIAVLKVVKESTTLTYEFHK